MQSNRKAKAKVMMDMLDLMNRMESKLAVLDALDRDVCGEDCMDLTDQVTSMTQAMDRLTKAVGRANSVNGVDAEYDALFGETA
jgi:hypothetical protein